MRIPAFKALWLGLVFALFASLPLKASYIYSFTSIGSGGDQFQFHVAAILTTTETITSWDSCSTGGGTCQEIDFVFAPRSTGTDLLYFKYLAADAGPQTHNYEFFPAGQLSGPGVYPSIPDGYTGTLTIQAQTQSQNGSVPEPSPVVLLFPVVVAIGWRIRFRSREMT